MTANSISDAVLPDPWPDAPADGAPCTCGASIRLRGALPEVEHALS